MTTIDELEARLRTPPPLDEQELLEALGEETTRLLRSAREAATDIRDEGRGARRRGSCTTPTRTPQRAAPGGRRGARRATTRPRRSRRACSKKPSSARPICMRVADERAAEVRDSAERYAEELRARVEREAAAEIDERARAGHRSSSKRRPACANA